MIHQTLHDGWQLSAVAGPVRADLAGRSLPAAVPGSTHLDLLAAGVIPDSSLDLNEQALTWMHRTDWRYALTWTGDLDLERQTFAGAALATTRLPLAVPARSVALVEPAESLVTPINPVEEVLVARTDQVRTTHLFAEDRDLAHHPTPPAARVEPVAGGCGPVAERWCTSATLIARRSSAPVRSA
jgi:hypothetical protein